VKSEKADKNLYEKHPTCSAETERRGEKTREGAKSGVVRLERMKHGSGIKTEMTDPEVWKSE
jgi:hypothetical protein